jgi:hypothetical protein
LIHPNLGRAWQVRVVPMVLAVCIGVGWSPFSWPASAQDLQTATPLISPQAPEAEQRRLLEHLLRQPGDYAATFEYVRIATERQDYEAAIGALERLLFYNPDLVRVKYELGVLYFRLGSYATAEAYFRQALASPALDDVTRQRIASYLPETKKQSDQSRWSGFGSLGLRYQSNATFAPDHNLVTFGGENFLVDQGSLGKHPDWNAFAIGAISNEYDFQNQRGDKLETRFFVYGTDQFRFREFNVGAIGFDIGPRFAISPDYLPGSTFKPYLVGDFFSLGGKPYLASGGGGLTATFPIGTAVSLTPGIEARATDYSENNPVPFSTFASGPWAQAYLASSVQVSDGLLLEARGAYGHGSARLSFQSFDQYALGGRARIDFNPPFAMIPRKWSLSPFVDLTFTNFEGVDAFVDPTRRRQDTELQVGAVADLAVTANFGVAITLQYDRTNSTIASYRNTDLSVSFGPTGRF